MQFLFLTARWKIIATVIGENLAWLLLNKVWISGPSFSKTEICESPAISVLYSFGTISVGNLFSFSIQKSYQDRLMHSFPENLGSPFLFCSRQLVFILKFHYNFYYHFFICLWIFSYNKNLDCSSGMFYTNKNFWIERVLMEFCHFILGIQWRLAFICIFYRLSKS